MTGTEIKALAESYVDDNISDADALMWLNAWLNRLGTEANSIASIVLNITNTASWINLPTGFLAVIEIVDTEDYSFADYKIRNGQIKLNSIGEYTLWYSKKPATMASITDTPDTHVLLHSPAALFVAGQYKFKDDDENPDAMRLMNFYEIEKKEALWQIYNPQQDNSAYIKVVE